jgi:hypothetical protein
MSKTITHRASAERAAVHVAARRRIAVPAAAR